MNKHLKSLPIYTKRWTEKYFKWGSCKAFIRHPGLDPGSPRVAKLWGLRVKPHKRELNKKVHITPKSGIVNLPKNKYRGE